MNKTKINFFKTPTFNMIVSGILMFFGAVLSMPYAGFLRTLPFMAVFGVLCEASKCSRKFTCAFAFAFAFVLYSVYGTGVLVSLLYGVISACLAILSMWAFKSWKTLVTKNYGKKKKSYYVLDAVGETLLFLLVFVLAFGNVFSFAKHDKVNTEYISKHYKDVVEKQFTYYDALDFKYKTNISFSDNEEKFGDENDCYISVKKGVLTDGFRDYCEDKMLKKTTLRLKQLLSMATPNPLDFEISNSYVEFENDEVLKLDSDGDDYLDRTVFVVSFYSVIENKADFYKLIEDYTNILKHDKSFTFKEILFCGGNASEILYTAVVNPETKEKDLTGLIHEFDEKEVLEYDITEKTYLDYWQNR